MKKSKARIILENLTGNQILQHKKEKGFYIEKYEDQFIINRNGKVIVDVETTEKIIKHHDTRNWQVKEVMP